MAVRLEDVRVLKEKATLEVFQAKGPNGTGEESRNREWVVRLVLA